MRGPPALVSKAILGFEMPTGMIAGGRLLDMRASLHSSWGPDGMPIYPREGTMRRSRTLMTQVWAVNLLLIVAAVVAATLATSSSFELSANPQAALVLGLAVALTILVNVFLLQRRMRPLERLVDEMER